MDRDDRRLVGVMQTCRKSISPNDLQAVYELHIQRRNGWPYRIAPAGGAAATTLATMTNATIAFLMPSTSP